MPLPTDFIVNNSVIIKNSNKQAHYDIDKDILNIKNGLFTFILRVNDGNITDYVVLESENYAKPRSPKVSRNNRKRSPKNKVGADNFQRIPKKQSADNKNIKHNSSKKAKVQEGK